ncbi:MAG: GTPase HflX [Limnochordaceae bacterium]|nr:GTPase HflX [Limnochordaceae bacterium]
MAYDGQGVDQQQKTPQQDTDGSPASRGRQPIYPTIPQPQRAFLVGLELTRQAGSSHPGGPGGRTGLGVPAQWQVDAEEGWTVEESLAELALLADTAGAIVVGQTVQRRPAPDPATLIGSGKAQEIEARRAQLGFDLVIFDEELTAVQQRNLESIIGCAIIDRTALILDIFAQRARSREAKLQVELAQLQYRLTRLAGKGVDLSRLGGGIGTRGPGETKLETDRRRIRERISHLRRELEEVSSRRQRLREERADHVHLPIVALTGYTNAGKSSLHRALTGSDVLVENRLFATLDATARRVQPGRSTSAGMGRKARTGTGQVESAGANVSASQDRGGGFILVDTVGFVQKLPHQLVAAFRSTLEEVAAADVILHVVDAGQPKRQEQIATVNQVLRELGADERKQIVVFNKIDTVTDSSEQAALAHLQRLYPRSVTVSARTGQGLEQLLAAVDQALTSRRQIVEVVVPYDQSSWVAWLHEYGQVLAERHQDNGTFIRAELDKALAKHLQAHLPAGLQLELAATPSVFPPERGRG